MFNDSLLYIFHDSLLQSNELWIKLYFNRSM